jgi:hypothetical protein
VQAGKTEGWKVMFWKRAGLTGKDEEFWKETERWDIRGLTEAWIEERRWETVKRRMPKGYRWICAGEM